eukprot:768792-Hanusia_phi.AAC.18
MGGGSSRRTGGQEEAAVRRGDVHWWVQEERMSSIAPACSQVVGRIRRARVDVNSVDGEGRTLLVLAVQAGQDEMVEELLKRKADVNRRILNGRNTALLEAVKVGREG